MFNHEAERRLYQTNSFLSPNRSLSPDELSHLCESRLILIQSTPRVWKFLVILDLFSLSYQGDRSERIKAVLWLNCPNIKTLIMPFDNPGRWIPTPHAVFRLRKLDFPKKSAKLSGEQSTALTLFFESQPELIEVCLPLKCTLNLSASCLPDLKFLTGRASFCFPLLSSGQRPLESLMLLDEPVPRDKFVRKLATQPRLKVLSLPRGRLLPLFSSSLATLRRLNLMLVRSLPTCSGHIDISCRHACILFSVSHSIQTKGRS